MPQEALQILSQKQHRGVIWTQSWPRRVVSIARGLLCTVGFERRGGRKKTIRKRTGENACVRADVSTRSRRCGEEATSSAGPLSHRRRKHPAQHTVACGDPALNRSCSLLPKEPSFNPINPHIVTSDVRNLCGFALPNQNVDPIPSSSILLLFFPQLDGNSIIVVSSLRACETTERPSKTKQSKAKQSVRCDRAHHVESERPVPPRRSHQTLAPRAQKGPGPEPAERLAGWPHITLPRTVSRWARELAERAAAPGGGWPDDVRTHTIPSPPGDVTWPFRNGWWLVKCKQADDLFFNIFILRNFTAKLPP